MTEGSQSFTARFRAHGHEGQVLVTYNVNQDPAHWGYDRLGFDTPPSEMAEGFPVVEAVVKYDGAGYLTYMGWIQIVRASYNNAPASAELDLAPNMRGSAQPFASWGPLPGLFDAPGTTGQPVSWRADSFLAVAPDLLMTRTVRPVFSFRWGYDVSPGGAVLPRPPQERGLEAWTELLPTLRESCPDWTFLTD